jgi:chaperonin GroES
LNEGIVVEVGNGQVKDGKTLPLFLKKGDYVLMPPFGGSLVKVNEQEFHLFKESELLAKISSQ